MRNIKLFIIFNLLFFNILPSLAEESVSNDAFKNGQDVMREGFSGQQAVTDGKFKKTIEMLKERQLSSKQKKERNRVVPLSPSFSEEHLREFSNISDGNDITHTLTVMIPVSAYTEFGQLIPPGYYKLSCKKTSDNKYVLILSQDSDTNYTVLAQNTEEDLEQPTINFCNAELSKDEKSIKLIYGNLGLNLVGYIYIKK